MIPQMIEDMDLYIDGVTNIGKVSDVTLPKLSRKMEEYIGSGMAAPIKIDYGLEALEISFTLSGYDYKNLKHFGEKDPAGINLRFLGSIYNANGLSEAVEISVRGRFQEIDRGDAKKQEEISTKFTMPITYYKETVSGKILIEIDAINNIHKINGNDILAQTRRNIGQ